MGFFDFLSGSTRPRAKSARRGAPRHRRPRLEPLEERTLLSAAFPDQADTGGQATGLAQPSMVIVGGGDTESLGDKSIIGGQLSRLYREYRAFVDAGGQIDDFAPSNPTLQVDAGRVAIEVVTIEPVTWEEVVDGEVVQVVNRDLIRQLEAVGMEITAMGPAVVGGWLAIDALDELGSLNGTIVSASAACGQTAGEEKGTSLIIGSNSTGLAVSAGEGGTAAQSVSPFLPPRSPFLRPDLLPEQDAGPDPSLPPWLLTELPDGRTLASIVGCNLARLHCEYEAFIAGGGEPDAFLPSDPGLPLSGNRVGVQILSEERIQWEEVDAFGDVVQIVNWAFLNELEAIGLQVTGFGDTTVSALLPFDAIDELAALDGVGSVYATTPLTHGDDTGPGELEGPELGLPSWMLVELEDGTDLAGVVNWNLARLHYDYESFIGVGRDSAAFTPSDPDLRVVGQRVPVHILAEEPVTWEEVDEFGDVVRVVNQPFIDELEAMGLQVTALGTITLGALLPFDAIEDLAALEGVGAVYATTPVTRVGDTDTQGDEAQRSDELRASLDVDGAGVSVGVLSDSYDQDEDALTHASDDVASGDLPAAGVTVLQDWDDDDATDEGRAMLQIVHDVAPGAALLFHSGFISPDDFALGIRELASAGADIIVDDVIWPIEPMFIDGQVAQAVDEVVADGVTYLSAAGNDADQSYESAFDDSGVTFFVGTAYEGRAHDFDPTGSTDYYQELTLGPKETIRLSFQWDEPAKSATGDA